MFIKQYNLSFRVVNLFLKKENLVASQQIKIHKKRKKAHIKKQLVIEHQNTIEINSIKNKKHLIFSNIKILK
jgi:hypothetical protein